MKVIVFLICHSCECGNPLGDQHRFLEINQNYNNGKTTLAINHCSVLEWAGNHQKKP
jgi:hypothetical protein